MIESCGKQKKATEGHGRLRTSLPSSRISRFSVALRCLLLLSVAFCGLPPRAAAQGAAPPQPVYELAPLVITAPRLKLPPQAVLNPNIDADLLELLQNHASERPTGANALDPSLQDLASLTTIDGYNLQTRYTQLGFLLTEGLAGAKRLDLQAALQNTAQSATNPQIQASAIVALAYTKDPQFLGIFQQALNPNSNLTARFAAIEALTLLGGDVAHQAVFNAAQSDPELILQIYAANALANFGDATTGKTILLSHYQDPDWLVRAMATHYLGLIGDQNTYQLLFLQLQTETQPVVLAELCSALIRLRNTQ